MHVDTQQQPAINVSCTRCSQLQQQLQESEQRNLQPQSRAGEQTHIILELRQKNALLDTQLLIHKEQSEHQIAYLNEQITELRAHLQHKDEIIAGMCIYCPL